MKLSEAMIVGIASALIAVALLRTANWTGTTELRLASQPGFDRVMKTRTLHCATSSRAGYVILDPYHNINRSIAHDIVEQMGRILELDIEWADEVPIKQAVAKLTDGSADALCSPLWPDGPRADTLDFTAPIDYMPLYAYARAEDARFDGNLSKINDADVTIAAIEGGEAKTIATEDFPKATQYSLTDVIDEPHLFLAVTTKKADIAFSDPFTADDFIKNNPSTLKQVANAPPLRVFGESFATAKGETKLRDTLNVALTQMQQSGFIRATLDKYLADRKGEFFYVGKGYEQ